MPSHIVQACIATNRQLAELVSCQPAGEASNTMMMALAVGMAIACLLAAVSGSRREGGR